MQKRREMKLPKLTLDFAIIREPIDELLAAFDNTLEREWPQKWSDLHDARTVVRANFKLIRVTYNVIRLLCKEKYQDPWQKPEFMTAVPPLTRTILDSVFTLVFLFDDIRTKAGLFKRGGWLEICEERAL
jgi:hypothetical protein